MWRLCSLLLLLVAVGAARADGKDGADGTDTPSADKTPDLVCGTPLIRDGRKLPAPPDARAALAQASVGGKYRMLLRQIRVPQDMLRYGRFHDWGYFAGTAYAGFRDLPPGHWVYVFPYWYIWRDQAADKRPARPWGPEQATGKPDTPQAGDRPSAWASRTADDADEWLLLEYARPLRPLAVLIYENHAPGALVKVTALKLDGTEVVIWQGRDPTPRNDRHGVSVLPVRVDFEFARLKIHLASKEVAGWNEIDAVGLLDAKGKVHWARSAHASSTWAEPHAPEIFVPPLLQMSRVLRPVPLPFQPQPRWIPTPFPPRLPPPDAQAEIDRLKALVEELKRKLRELEEKGKPPTPPERKR